MYQKKAGVDSRWWSFENPTGEKGMACLDNAGGKGHAYDDIPAESTVTLMDAKGSGCVRRIWMTTQRDLIALRGLVIRMYWDGAEKPAVEAPLGDFFGTALARRAPFECALFSDPEARSFNCMIDMPFKKSARVTLSNETKEKRTVFYEINATLGEVHDDDMMYFHAAWRRENPVTLGEDFRILPALKGSGRFIGANVGVIADPRYDAWWGEGEYKVFIDGDGDSPTLSTTGLEDYVGTGWGLRAYAHQYYGCPIADAEQKQYCFYRYHIPDPVWFDQDIKVTLQQLGGTRGSIGRKMWGEGIPIKPATFATKTKMINCLTHDPVLDYSNVDEFFDPELIDSSCCVFYKLDDYCACAYWYMLEPESTAEPIAGLADRIAGLSDEEKANVRADL